MIRTLAAALATSTCIVAVATPAAAQTREYNIPAGSLKSALDAYVRQSGRQIVYRADQVRSARSRGTRGQQSAEAALAAVLAGSGFTTRADGNLVAIVREGNAPSAPDNVASSGDDGYSIAEEIVVTAQKREERLQDVPVPVTAVNARAIEASNLLRLQDYFTRIPGLSLTPVDGQGQGAPKIIIRGLSTGGFANPTVGVVIDDVSFGASTRVAGGQSVPDIDPSELERIEVLRGPQGTLYGASSMGGLLKYVTVAPSTRDFGGRVSVNLNSVENGDEAGYSLRGALNVPITDTLAVRLSGFTRQDAGYINNTVTGEEGVNRRRVNGARLSARWSPIESFSLTLSALYQNGRTDGSSDVYVQPGFGDLEQGQLIGTGGYRNELQAYSATARLDTGAGELTSITGYSLNGQFNVQDIPAFADLTEAFFGVRGTSGTTDFETEKFSQELRYFVPLAEAVDLLVGGYYGNEHTPQFTEIRAINSVSGAEAGSWETFEGTFDFREIAAFSNLTVRLSDRFDVQVGARYSWNRQGSESVETGLLPEVFYGVSPKIEPKVVSNDEAFTYLLTPRLHIGLDTIAYVRLASGFRPGGPNANLSTDVPDQYNPDKTYSYEAGFKGSLLDKRLNFDISLYTIDWRDIQIQSLDPVFGAVYIANGGRARSRGAEVSLEVRPTTTTSFSGWVAYNEAELREGLPAGSLTFGLAGDRLPNSPRWSANLSFDQRVPLAVNAEGSFGASVNYVGDRVGPFLGAAGPRQDLEGFTTFDLRAGIDFGGWAIDAYVNNVTDKRGLLGGGVGTFNPVGFSYVQPRNAGVTASARF